MNKSPCPSRCGLAATVTGMQRPSGEIAIAYIEGIVVYSSAAQARDSSIMISEPGPAGHAALGCGPGGTLPGPAGTLEENQAVTL